MKLTGDQRAPKKADGKNRALTAREKMIVAKADTREQGELKGKGKGKDKRGKGSDDGP